MSSDIAAQPPQRCQATVDCQIEEHDVDSASCKKWGQLVDPGRRADNADRPFLCEHMGQTLAVDPHRRDHDEPRPRVRAASYSNTSSPRHRADPMPRSLTFITHVTGTGPGFPDEGSNPSRGAGMSSVRPNVAPAPASSLVANSVNLLQQDQYRSIGLTEI